MATYDFILFGATGVTGGLCIEYLADQDKTDAQKKLLQNSIKKWAVCSRSRNKVEKVIEKYKENLEKNGIPLPEILISDLCPVNADEEKTLSDIVKSTNVVMTTSGPYLKYGETLVKLCAELGVDYCDVTGETVFVRSMISKYDEKASKTGAKIVVHCGHDCIPWDLSTFKLHELCKKLDAEDAVNEIKAYVDMRMNVSGGTIDTMYNMVGRKEDKTSFDPLLQVNDSAENKLIVLSKVDDQSERVVKSNFNSKTKFQKNIEFDKDVGTFTQSWVMTSVNGNCVKRSNAILGYNENLVYADNRIFPDSTFWSRLVMQIRMFFFVLSFKVAVLRWIFRNFILPKPGELLVYTKPEDGFLYVTVHATTEKQRKLKAVMKFHKDAAYKDTARMLVESGLGLLAERNAAQSQASSPASGIRNFFGGSPKNSTTLRNRANCGVVTPAVGLGGAIVDRLCATGCEFAVKEVKDWGQVSSM